MRKILGQFTSCVAFSAVMFTAGCGGSEQSADSRSGIAPAASAPSGSAPVPGFNPADASNVKASEAPSPPKD